MNNRLFHHLLTSIPPGKAIRGCDRVSMSSYCFKTGAFGCVHYYKASIIAKTTNYCAVIELRN